MNITKNEIVEKYKYHCEKFESIAKDKNGSVLSLFEEASKKVVREELCSGSDMFLGFYNPSPVYDLIVGNVHRGRLLKRITKSSKPSHKYGFDKDGRLCTVVTLPVDPDTYVDKRAFFEYSGDTAAVIGFEYVYGEAEITEIAECSFGKDGKLTEYMTGLLNNSKCSLIEGEMYTYGNGGMEGVVLWDCQNVQNVMTGEFAVEYDSFLNSFGEKGQKLRDEIAQTSCMTRIYIYRLYHDSNGYITSYENVGGEYRDGHIFEIPEHRRRIF